MTPEPERRLTAQVTAALVEAMRAHEGEGRGRMDLADQRVIGPYEGSKSREVLMDLMQVDELVRDLDDANS